MHRSSSIATVLLLTAAGAAPGASAAGQRLEYVLPSPATATYMMVDNTEMSMADTPMGPIEIAGESSFTYAVTVASEGDGVRVSAVLEQFEASMNNPMMGGLVTFTQTQAGAESSFEVVLGGQGLAEVVSGSRRPEGDLPILVDPHAVMFPRLPGGDVNTGDTWTDTVATMVGDGGDRVVVHTYTLEGEVTHEGRSHLRIAVSGESDMTIGEGDLVMNLTGSESGHYLWDIERGLVGSAELSRTEEGGMTAPDGSEIKIKYAGATRLTLEN